MKRPLGVATTATRAQTLTLGLTAALLACDASAPADRLDPGLADRIARAKSEARSRPEALLDLGKLQLEAGQLFEASEALLAAREQGLDRVEVDAGLARAYLRLGYVDATVRSLRACFSKAREQPDCLFVFASLLSRDPQEPAQREAQRVWMRFLRAAPSGHPDRGYAQSALAQLEGRFGELSEEALASPGPLGSSAEGPPPASPTQGSAPPVPGHEGGDTDRPVAGLNPFGKALQTAYRAMSAEDWDAAVAAFEAALELRADDPTTLAGLAEAHMASQDMEAAIEAAEKAWSLAPTEPQVRYAFGLVMLRNQRRPREAIQAWRDLMKDDPEYARRVGVDTLLQATGDPTSGGE